jgi:hypothetical protein
MQHMFGSRFTRHAGCLLVALVATACGSDEKSSSVELPQPSIQPEIVSFDADPGTIQAGSSTTLNWRTRDVVAIALADDRGTQLPLDGAEITQGSVTVTPDRNTSYTLTASGAEGTAGPVWRTVLVTVEPGNADAPTVESFSASAELVPAGGEVVLSWRTSNATRVTVQDDAGVLVAPADADPGAGETTVRPNRSPTTYSLTATGPGGSTEARVRVDVTGLPRVSRFFVDPMAPVNAGDPVTVYWETQNATHVVIRRAGTTVVDTTTEFSGSRELPLADTATFDIEATGPGGSATANVLAQVGPRIVSFAASQRVVRVGDSVHFSWELADADTAVIDGPADFHLPLTGTDLTAGQTDVTVTETGPYVIQAFHGSVPRSASIAIETTQAPRVRTITVDQPQVTAAADLAATVNLSWTQDGADYCVVYANNSVVEGLDHLDCGPTGSVPVPVYGTTTLRLDAVNPSGRHAASLVVEAFPPARIVAFASEPHRRLTPGDEVALTWEVTDAVGVSMEKNTAPFAIGSTDFNGTATDTVAADSTYVLTAVNSRGYPTRAEVSLVAGPPAILAAAANPTFVGIGQQFAIEWTADGGNELTLVGPDATELFRTTDPAVIDHGSAPVLAPIVAGTYTYTLTDVNGAGSATQTVAVTVSDGPMITSFTVSKSSISLTETLTFSWVVTDDPAGTHPTLALADDAGHTFADIATKNPNNGSVTITPATEGHFVYTLTASTTGHVPSSRSVEVEITVAPVVRAFTATPDSATTNGGQDVPTVELAWQTENAVELTLWESSAAGVVVPPPFKRVSLANGDTQEAINAGTYTVHPAVTTYYVARAKNRIGSFVDQKIKVTIDPPEITSFAATPAEIAQGQTAQLAWTTHNAVSVVLAPPPIRQTTGNFIDVSTLPGAATITLSDDDSGVGNLTFPGGFTFPFEGANKTALQVTTNGTAGFNTASTSYTGYSSTVPNSDAGHLNYSLYGCDLDSDDNTPNGTLWYAKSSDAEGEFVVVEWKDWGWWSSHNPSNLNFELILRANGDFEYRYGAMTAATADYASGRNCLIGFQGTTSAKPYGLMVPFQTALAGGLAGKGFAVQMAMPTNGSVAVSPLADTSYTLTATSADGSVTATAPVVVWKQPAITAVRTAPLAPVATQPFTISWTTTDANGLRVLDDTGAAICTVTVPAQIAAGSCTATAATPGIHNFTVEAVNGPLGHAIATVTMPFSFNVYSYLAVTSFEVSPTQFVNSGDTVTLNWTSSPAAVDMALWACVPKPVHANCVDITPSGANARSGTTTYRVTKSTEFWLQIYDVQTLGAAASQFAWVGNNQVEMGAPLVQVAPGGSKTLSWNITGPGPIILDTNLYPFIEIASSGAAPTLAGSDDSGRYSITFPTNFTFPWFGSNKTGLVATTDGWLTFNTSYSSTAAGNAALPASNADLAIAPFWDDGKRIDPAKVVWQLFTPPTGPKYLVVEWSDYKIYADSGSHLNYEVVLWEDGGLDFRYGTMTGSSGYEARVRGSGATIGFQSPDRSQYWQLTSDAEVPGGLANRTFRVIASPGSASTTVSPTESTTYRVCAENSSMYKACDEVRVVVVKAGDLLFTEAMIAPTATAAEWFEMKNVSPDPIDLAGFVLASGPEQFPIPPGTPLVVPAGAYAVFARSGDAAVNGGLAPTQVYDTLTLDDVTDSLGLFMGAIPIDTITWGAGWNIQANQSVAFEPTLEARNPAANDPATAWCPTTAVYGNGTFGGSPGTAGTGCLP